MLRIAVFVSGRGSNLKAILNAIPNDLHDVEVSAVLSNKADCPALDIARKRNIPTYSVSYKSKEGYKTFSDLSGLFAELKIDLIVLAGFLKKIPDEIIDLFENKIINIHPALLPSFGGKGMYGMNVHEAVFNSSAQVSGATVHFVDKIYDNGKIIAQRTVDISDVKNAEEIAQRVLKIEHKLLPFVIGKFSEKKVFIKNNRVIILD
ncbi:phosphoribosylglycinamide formyltransferase [Bacteroidota bacterium]